jgi:hypothetical protein
MIVACGILTSLLALALPRRTRAAPPALVLAPTSA